MLEKIALIEHEIFANNTLIKIDNIMKHFFLLLSFTLLFISHSNLSFSQKKIDKKNTVGISIPFVWNNSSGVYYTLGNRKESQGKAISYGINLNYSKKIWKNIFGIVAIGYFKQVFGIKRPFDFNAPDGTEPLVQTKSYIYNNLYLSIGIGQQIKLNETFFINGVVVYNSYNSFNVIDIRISP